MTEHGARREPSAVEMFDLYIDGAFRPAVGGARFASQNPFTGQDWASVADGDSRDIDLAVAAATRALKGEWRAQPGAARARLMTKLADIVERDARDLARAEMHDNGKVRRDAEAQVKMIPVWLRYFAGLADKIEGQALSDVKPGYFAYTRREPIGVVGAILPWNAPLLLMVYKLAPALAAGCTFVAKPSEFTPASTLAFASCVSEAGFPAGVFNVVTSSSRDTGAALAAHRGVARVAFTGSTRTGIAVAKLAADHVARVSLELGGKSPQLVFADCDLEAAVNGVVAGVFAASGQMCHAGSRVYVERSIYDEFLARLKAKVGEIKLGDPEQEATDMGPISTAAQFERVVELIEQARGKGADVFVSEAQVPVGGYFISPTIVTGINASFAIAREEVFGPVVIVTPFDDEETAVWMANNSDYGLAAGIWTSDIRRVHLLAASLQVGNIWVNCYRVASPAVPFGGSKLSGVGRENGADAMLEYLETKSVWIELTGNTSDPFRMG
ncbi:MAG: carnitine dehydratase [Bradyrhizobium sp.]|nr:carnitine dehydratase [Bradyrhizobium sp.]